MPLSCPRWGASMTAVCWQDAHHSRSLPSPHLQCSWAHSGPAHTSHRPSHGSPRGSGTPHCPGARPGTGPGPSMPCPAALGTAHTVCQRSRGSSQAPAGRGSRRGPHRPGQEHVGSGPDIVGPQSQRTKQGGPREKETTFYNTLHGRGETQAGKGCARSHSEGQSRTLLLPLGLSGWCQLWAVLLFPFPSLGA